ncbi:MAG: hypothetical protein ACLFS7_07525 [Desulfosudaceae bacterium]
MTAAYFPFASIDEDRLRALWFCFDDIVLYLPSATAADSLPPAVADFDGLEIQVPSEDVDQQVESLYQACAQWREATAGAAPAFFKSGRAPFFDETTISYMRQEIVKGSSPAADGKPDPVLNARVFLRLTSDHDHRQAAVENSLNLLKDRERALFEALNGGDGDDSPGRWSLGVDPGSAGSRLDPGREMTAARLSAWAILALASPAAPDLLVTTSPAVLDRLDETRPGGQRLVNQRLLPFAEADRDGSAGRQWRKDLARSIDDYLSQGDPELFIPPFARSAPDPEPESGLKLEILTYPDTGLADFLAHLSGRDNIRPADFPGLTAPRTIIACLRSG